MYVLNKYFTALFYVQVGAKPNLILIDCSESELEKSLRSSRDSKLLSRRSLKSYRENTIPLLKVLDKQNRLKIVSVHFRLTKKKFPLLINLSFQVDGDLQESDIINQLELSIRREIFHLKNDVGVFENLS